MDGEIAYPIRTIYFESASAFPEINSFTYETAKRSGIKLFPFHFIFFPFFVHTAVLDFSFKEHSMKLPKLRYRIT